MLGKHAVPYTLILILVVVVSPLSSTLLVVESAWADSVIKTITVGTGPYGDLFNPDNGYIYVANQFSNSVSVIDGSTNMVIATVTEPPNQTPRELAFNSENGYMNLHEQKVLHFLMIGTRFVDE
jgi:YVTN family beta-propeller protein